MPFQPEGQHNGNQSPGGFEFGLQGWHWSDPKPRAITFFLDGTAMVTDQYGRPIKGASYDGKEVYFATRPPQQDDPNAGYAVQYGGGNINAVRKVKLGTHAEVIAALRAEGVDWATLTRAGWPQVPYEFLKKVFGEDLSNLPPTPMDDLKKIRDPNMRRDAFKARMEHDDRVRLESEQVEAELAEQLREARAEKSRAEKASS